MKTVAFLCIATSMMFWSVELHALSRISFMYSTLPDIAKHVESDLVSENGTTATTSSTTAPAAAGSQDIVKQVNFSSTSEKFQKSFTVQSDEILTAKAADLQSMKSRFYMYDDANITQVDNPLLKRLRPREMHRMVDAEYDEQMLETLHKSDLRTLNPDEAELFIAPIPICRILVSRHMNYNVPFEELVNHEIFRKHQGNNHVLISTTFVLFRQDTRSYTSMKGWYDKIWNTTVMLSWDPNAVYNEFKDGADWGEYTEVLSSSKGVLGPRGPLTKRSASLSLGSGNDGLELRLATKEKFFNSSNFVFYHSTTATSLYNSTIHRHAPITNITLDDNFPKSSIGWPIDKEEWERSFRNSKFCLNIRGDSPHSHSLWRSIRVGCIPVIASDHLPTFAPLFKSTLNMSDFSVMLKEQDLVNNPTQTLLKLNDMSEDEIESKIKHLAFAQRVIFTDHPQSLFVPAFLREAKQATVAKMNK